ncbi:hypothetical protein RRG08_037040 [Elysia crispata]|uniref:Uncharacterized protein n=1 Tax=Elysia crispata TaxID=231223 RepID=A0AAE0YA32_9GAST|nr:hypothetical protein RRG08_037040 [Elysia crispata]
MCLGTGTRCPRKIPSNGAKIWTPQRKQLRSAADNAIRLYGPMQVVSISLFMAPINGKSLVVSVHASGKQWRHYRFCPWTVTS